MAIGAECISLIDLIAPPLKHPGQASAGTSRELDGDPRCRLPLTETCGGPPRRVGPWIDEDEYLPPDRPALCLPWPSTHALRALHALPWVQRLAAVLDQRIAVAVERPAVRHPGSEPGRWTVVLMFNCVVELADRAVHGVSLRRPDWQEPLWTETSLQAGGTCLGSYRLSVWPAPCRELWMSYYEQGFEHQLRRQLGSLADAAIRSYASWMVRQMARRHWTPARRQQARREVAQALDLDADALAMARDTRARRSTADVVTAADYNRMLAGRQRFGEVKRVAPTLFVLYQLADAFLPRTAEPLKALRDWVLAAPQLKPRHWRWMQRHGTRWLWQVLDCLGPLNEKALRDALALGAALDFEGPASPGLLRAVTRLYANPNRPGASGSGWSKSPVTGALARWWRRCDPADRPALAAVAPALANWLEDRNTDAQARHWGRCGWRRAQRAMVLDAVRERQDQNGDAAPWPLAEQVDGLRQGSLIVQALRRPVDVIEEAQAMRHCARQYLPLCERQIAVMVSIRNEASGARVATAMLRRGPRGWAVAQIAGFANALASGAAVRLASQLARRLEARGPPTAGG